MANLKTLLDARRQKLDGSFSIIFRITHDRKVYTLNSGISTTAVYWDHQRSEIHKTHPNSKLLNINLSKQFFKIQQIVLELDSDFSIIELKNRVEGKSKDIEKITVKSFSDHLILQMLEINKTGNALVYQTALNRLIAFYGKDDLDFKDLNYEFLERFKHHLLLNGLKINSISNYIRTIRAIYNKAIKLKVVDRSLYPFYDVDIKIEKTANRAVLKDDLNKLLHISVLENSTAWKSLNYFFLSFYLRGISFTDMAYLKKSDVIHGRVNYTRRKTHKNYSVRLYGKAESLINQLHISGSEYLLSILPIGVPEDSLKAKIIIRQWIKTTNKYLKKVSIECGLVNPVTTYSSRYSFATIAKRLGYSNELIAEALGHEYGNKITNIYLDDFDVEVLDAMHQHVIE